MSGLYDTDFYAWANQQVALLRAGDLDRADIANIAEEIATMGRSEKRELVSRLTNLLLHRLKWRYQPGRRGVSWQTSMAIARLEITRHLADNPSLAAGLAESMARAYEVARLKAARETGLAEDVFPPECPWTFDEAMADA